VVTKVRPDERPPRGPVVRSFGVGPCGVDVEATELVEHRAAGREVWLAEAAGEEQALAVCARGRGAVVSDGEDAWVEAPAHAPDAPEDVGALEPDDEGGEASGGEPVEGAGAGVWDRPQLDVEVANEIARQEVEDAGVTAVEAAGFLGAGDDGRDSECAQLFEEPAAIEPGAFPVEGAV
jgi:hypothetical protein